MVYMTMIARITDGLPLAASMQEDQHMGKSLLEYQQQAKRLFKTLTTTSPTQCSLESGHFFFHYIIEQDVCFLALCERSFNKRLAYSYLQDLAQEFYNQFGSRIATASRPYSFIEFDTYIQKAKKTYTDTRGRRNLSNLNSELQDVQRIMVQNIDDVLQRGVVMSELDRKANDLSMRSQQYRQEAQGLNATSWVAIGAGLSVLFIVFFFWYKFLL